MHPALRDWMRDRIHRNLLYRAAREGALVLGWRRPPLVYDRKSFRQLEQFRIRIGQSQIRHRKRLRSDSWVRPGGNGGVGSGSMGSWDCTTLPASPTMVTAERPASRVGHITLGGKQTGKTIAGNRHEWV